MPKKAERKIRKQGGVSKYRKIKKKGGGTMTCAITRKKGPRGGKTVCWDG
uniref:Uncharacterized protein n=1 Tax=viral metagenome TaxID=1070528 RepID=A0A6M3XMU3_9ZZZZ